MSTIVRNAQMVTINGASISAPAMNALRKVTRRDRESDGMLADTFTGELRDAKFFDFAQPNSFRRVTTGGAREIEIQLLNSGPENVEI